MRSSAISKRELSPSSAEARTFRGFGHPSVRPPATRVARPQWQLRAHGGRLAERKTSLAGEPADVVEPGRLRGPLLEELVKAVEKRPKVVVAKTGDEDAPGVSAPALCPALDQRSEVLYVEGGHRSPLGGSQLEEILVAPAIEVALLVSGANVVSPVPKGLSHSPARDVGVEEEAHRALLLGGKRGEEGPVFVDRALVLRDRLIDLLRKATVVGEGQTNLAFRQVGLGDHALG